MHFSGFYSDKTVCKDVQNKDQANIMKYLNDSSTVCVMSTYDDFEEMHFY